MEPSPQQDNLTTRSLLKGILATESIRPAVSHQTKRSISRTSISRVIQHNASPAAPSSMQSRKKNAKHSLRKQIPVDTSLHRINTRSKRKSDKLTFHNVVDDLSNITPQTLLKKIIQTEDETSVVVSKRSKMTIDTEAEQESPGSTSTNRSFQDLAGTSTQSEHNRILLRKPNKPFFVSLPDFEQGVEEKCRLIKGSQECFIESAVESSASLSKVAELNTELYAQSLVSELNICSAEKSLKKSLKAKEKDVRINLSNKARGPSTELSGILREDLDRSGASRSQKFVPVQEDAEDLVLDLSIPGFLLNKPLKSVHTERDNTGFHQEEDRQKPLSTVESIKSSKRHSYTLRSPSLLGEARCLQIEELQDESSMVEKDASSLKRSLRIQNSELVMEKEHGDHSKSDEHGDHSKSDERGDHSKSDERGDHSKSDERGDHSKSDEHEDRRKSDDRGDHRKSDERGDHSKSDEHEDRRKSDERGDHRKSDERGDHRKSERGDHRKSDERGDHRKYDELMASTSGVEALLPQSILAETGRKDNMNNIPRSIKNSELKENCTQYEKSLNTRTLHYENTILSSQGHNSNELSLVESSNDNELTTGHPKKVNEQHTLLAMTETPAYLKNVKSMLPTKIAARKKIQKATSVKKKKEGLLCNSSFVKQTFAHHAKMRVSKDAYADVEKCFDVYFDRLTDDLAAYTAHANRNTLTLADVKLLMERQRLVTSTTSLDVLIERHLPLQYRKLLLPCAMGGSKVFPKM